MEPPTLRVPDADEASSSGAETFAGALVLMTAHAEAPAHKRAALAREVSTQLLRVAGLACASAECRLALLVLAAHWAALSVDGLATDGDSGLSHAAPALLQ